MPPPIPLEYNPNIIGFIADRGPVVISLKKARSIYGKLPSDFKFVPKKDGRQNKKGLNLDIGKLLTEKLNNEGVNLKQTVFTFFQGWHRDYENEFNIDMDPFLNLNPPDVVKRVLKTNDTVIVKISHLNLRPHLKKSHLIRKDVLNSIQEKDLSKTAEKILTKKIKHLNSEEKRKTLCDTLTRIRANRILEEIKSDTSFDIAQKEYSLLSIYADEISKKILKLSLHIKLSGIDQLKGVRGNGIEFEFATRNASYLALGKETGDCTAHKAPFQADRDTENIYWTVFPWMLDRNYQILKVYYYGDLIMKFHLLPVFILQKDERRMALAVDGIETVRAFRDDIQESHRDDLMGNKSLIFNEALERIKALGCQMGIDHIYAEKFSNTRWVREHLDTLPEIYLHVNNIIKLDELEDVFTLSQELCKGAGAHMPKEIFMEIQMKNTALLPRVTSKTAGIKSFAIIRGNPAHGIPMKKVLGV